MIHDEHVVGAVNWTIPGYWILNVASIAVCCLLTFLLIKTMVMADHRKSFMTNKYALVLLIVVIFHGFYKPLIMWGFIFDLNPSCTVTSKRFDQSVLFFGIVMRWFMILKFVEINFQKFPLLAYSNRFISALKLAMIMFATIMVIFRIRFFPVKFFSYHQKTQSDKYTHVCVQSEDETTVTNHLSLQIPLAAAVTILHIYLCALFIRKANQLYYYVKQGIKPSDERSIVDGIEKLSRVMQPIYRHTILVVTITLSLVSFRIVRMMVASEGIPLDPLDNLTVGLACISMFPFGKWYYKLFCGCCQRKLIEQWLVREIEFYNQQRLNALYAIGEYKVEVELSTIPEETSNQIANLKATSSTTMNDSSTVEVPTFGDWKSIEESMELERLKRRLNAIIELGSDENMQIEN